MEPAPSLDEDDESSAPVPESFDIVLVGPGNAGLALGLAAKAAGHKIVAVVGRSPDSVQSAAARLGSRPVELGTDLPDADLMLIAVSDDAIVTVAQTTARSVGELAGVAHLSGLTPVAALASFTCPTGSLHPLQTLPSPEVGAARLAGSWAAVTADEPFADHLAAFAESLGLKPFRLDDESKALYHAAAAAAANYTLGALGMAADLFEAAGLPFDVSQPLVSAIVDNAYALGPWQSLTGPIARGDVGTIRAQLEAVSGVSESHRAAFAEMGSALALLAGASEVRELFE